MRTVDIQTGDWVRLRYKSYPENKEIVADFRVSQIAEHGPKMYAWSKEQGNMGPVVDLEPISITPEILEKNGFVKCIGGRSKKSLQLIGDGLYVSWWNDRIVIRYKRVLGHPSAYLNCDCRYVHELQHALRLSGVEKEIEL